MKAAAFFFFFFFSLCRPNGYLADLQKSFFGLDESEELYKLR